MNAAYRYWERIDWYPTHYCCLDDELIATHHGAIKALVAERLVESAFVTAKLLDFHPELAEDQRFLFLDSVQPYWYEERGRALRLPWIEHPAFATSSPSKLTTGAYAVRYAVFLGYRRIYLAGIDCNYVPLTGNGGARSLGGIALEMTHTPEVNPNYFFDDYQQAGDRYNVPNPEVHGPNLHLQSLVAVRDDFLERELAVTIHNCSRESKLATEGIFPYEELDQALGEPLLGAVALPMTFQEERALIANLRLWSEPRFIPRYPETDDGYAVPLVLVLNGGPDAGFEKRVRTAFESCGALRVSFHSINFEYCRLTHDEDRYETDYSRPPGPSGYKSGPNTQFFRGIKLLRSYGRYVLAIEIDCVPIRPNWLTELERLVGSAEPFWILGSLYRGVGPLDDLRRLHINGNAVYAVGDPEFQAFVDDVWWPALRALLGTDPTFAYDCVLSAHFVLSELQPGSEKWALYQDVAHRFRYTDFIQNHAGRAELDRGEGHPLETIRAKSPSTYIVHGRHLARALQGRASETREEAEGRSSAHCPRLLVIDSTRVGGLSATGQLKARLLRGWRDDSFLQIHTPSPDGYVLARSTHPDPADVVVSEEVLYEEVAAFDPEVIYFRPTIDLHPHLQALANEILARHPVPLVTHIMDDWPLRLERKDPELGREANRQLRDVLARSVKALSISDRMSEVFSTRYGVSFEAVANGIDPASCRAAQEAVARERERRTGVLLRYCGAIAKDMTFQTLADVARAVDRLHDEVPIRFEVYTMPMWRRPFEEAVEGLRGVTVAESVPDDEYPRLLAGADVVVLAYNFDEESVRYIGLSMPNKLPEYLGSGAAVLAVGPVDTAAVDYLMSHDLACCVTEPEPGKLVAALRRLSTDEAYRSALSANAQAWAFNHLDIGPISGRFQTILREAAASAAPQTLLGPFSRDQQAHVDEARSIAALVAASGPEHVLIDVGAHHGSALRPFAESHWTVVAFEPDESNRAILTEKFGANGNVTIDPRAVSDEVADQAAFFVSDESTGISGLHAFRESHRQTQTVRVTTLTEFIESHGLNAVTFLKIDVEGFELHVLRGLPWTRNQPEVIACEFEDRKTIPLGYTYRDLANYLVGKGYTVYVSEWHPVVRYGIRHDWRQLMRYPAPLASPDAWGNLVAFLRDPGSKVVQAAFMTYLESETPTPERPDARPTAQSLPITQRQEEEGSDRSTEPGAGDIPADTSGAPHEAAGLATSSQGLHVLAEPAEMTAAHAQPALVLPPDASAYDRLYVWARTRSPVIFALGQLAMWCARGARRHPVWTGGYVALLAALVAVGLWAAPGGYGAVAWIAVSLLVVASLALLATGFVLSLVRSIEREHAERDQTVRERLTRLEGYLRSGWAQHDARLGTLENASGTAEQRLREVEAAWQSGESRLAAAVDELRADQQKLQHRVAATETSISSGHDSIGAHKATIRDLQAEQRILDARLGELRAGLQAREATLGTRIRSLRTELQSLHQRLHDAESSIALGHESAGAQEERLGQLEAQQAALGGRLVELRSQQQAAEATFGAKMDELEPRLAAHEKLSAELDALRGQVGQDQLDLGQRLQRAEEALRSAEEHEARLRELQTERQALLSPIDELRSKQIALDAAIAEIHAERAVLLDIVSTLRKLRPLWEGGSPDSLHVDEREHGHALLIALLVQEALVQPGILAGKTLLEVGTTRERDPRQGSTEKLAILSGLMEMRFTSVDMDPLNTKRAAGVVQHLNPDAKIVTAKGEDYLVGLTEPVDYVYLDAFDFEHGQHSPERRARYREVLGSEITNEEAWKMHMVCAAALVKKLSDDGIVVIDDTWTDEHSEFDGKGKLAVPLLLSSGFAIVARTPRAIALRRAAVDTQAEQT